MTALVLPFPRSRDLAYVRRHAEHFRSRRTSEAAERYLQLQLRVQADTLRRRGVSDEFVILEVALLEAAIRREGYRPKATPGGVA